MSKGNTYADAGVNIELGDDVSKIMYNAAKQTWDNRKGELGELIVPFDDFSGVRSIDVSGLTEGTLMNIGFDGVGTKMKNAEAIDDHTTIAYDLFAMVCDDAVVRGAEPVLIGSILDVNSLGSGDKTHIKQVNQLAQGYINAAKDANVAIVNGEVAELGDRVGGYGSPAFINQLAHQYISTNMDVWNWKRMRNLSAYLSTPDKDIQKIIFNELKSPEREFIEAADKMRTLNYNWGAAVVWFANKDRLFTGNEIKEGDYLVGFKEEGFRSNGLSLVSRIMPKYRGEDWYFREGVSGDKTLGEEVLTPSRIYTGAVVDMIGGYNKDPRVEVHGVAHITGGGIPGKLGRMLKPSKLGADIDNPFNPSKIMKYVQRLGSVEDREAYKTWNMGQGMVVATPDPRGVIKIAEEYGIGAKNMGKVTKNPKIKIRNYGAQQPFSPEVLVFENN